VFGTFTVDEDKKTVTYQIAASTFPKAHTRTIERLTAEAFSNTNPAVAGGRGLQS